jgi:hypothetical protein
MDGGPEDPTPGRFDSIADFYGQEVQKGSDPLQHALQTWDHNEYLPLRSRDPELYGLICNQVGSEIDILVGDGSVKLGTNNRYITLTWNGDDEDLFDLVLEGAALISGEDG